MSKSINWRKEKFFFILCISFLITSCNPNRNITRHYVDSDSMSPSINPGDYVLVDSTLRTFDYGDILCYYFEGNKDLEPYMNAYRVVGLPGDSIEVKYDICVINGKQNPTEYTPNSKKGRYFLESEEELPNGIKIIIHHNAPGNHNVDRDPLRIPQDHYFIVGDYRCTSIDSRYFGAVHKDKILGKVIKVIKGHK